MKFTIHFVGGLFDGHSEEVPTDKGWQNIKKIGLATRTGKVVSQYERIGITQTEAMFYFKPDLVLEPGEVSRIIKLIPQYHP